MRSRGASNSFHLRLAEWHWAFLSCAVISLALVLLAFQEYPGMSASSSALLIDTGYAQCLSNGWREGFMGCASNLGQPIGGVRTFGLPSVALTAALFGWDGVVSFDEMQLVMSFFTAVAFSGAVLLFRRLTGSIWLGLLGALIYLLAPIVSQQGSYGTLRTGYALLPLYLLIDRSLLDIEMKRWRAGVLIVAVVVLVRIFSVLCDGYSFVMSSGIALCLYLVTAFDTRRIKAPGAAIALYAMACAAAYYCYFLFVPGGRSGLGVMPNDFFRGQGVDLYTVLMPSPLYWLYRTLGVAFDFPSVMAFGDGSNVGFNFAGYSFLLSAGIVVLNRLLGGRKLGSLLASLGLSGLMAFALSLGPSLKYKSFQVPETDGPAHFTTYLMPADQAVARLGTDAVYQKVPGVKNIRVLARWQGVVHFALTGFLLALLSWLIEQRRRVLAGILSLAALVESSPNLVDGVFRDGMGSRLFGPNESAFARRSEADAVRDRYLPELGRMAARHERALFIQLNEGADSNHAMVDYLCPAANLRCYNIGGDKALEIVRDGWPQEVEELLVRRNVEFNIRQLLRSHQADVVLVSLFSLRRPASAQDVVKFDKSAVLRRVDAVTLGGNYKRMDGQYFISLRPSAKLLESPDCGVSCWSKWPEVTGHGRIIDWGPSTEILGQGFNRQINGRSAFWVRVKDDPDQYVISFGGTLLPTYSGPGVVTALLPSQFEAWLEGSRSYNVRVIDVSRSTQIPLGEFTVAEQSTHIRD